MKTGFRGTFVISWGQTELDGQRASPLSSLQVGAVWAWQGEAVRVDGPSGILPLGDARGVGELRRRAAFTVRRLLKAVEADTTRLDEIEVDLPMFETGFEVTDGRELWNVTLIDAGPAKHPLCVFVGEIPPRRTELWVVRHNVDLTAEARTTTVPPGLICFTSGTLISTEHGDLPVEEVTLGTRVQTRDNGLQEVLWTGSKRVTGARLHAMPHLAPVRLTGFGDGAPLVVSPDHRILLQGGAARDLFNTDEVLVAAADLVDGTRGSVERGRREVVYHHLLCGAHQILFANGVETESFHPGNGALAGLEAGARSALLSSFPDLSEDPMRYGGYARRLLDPSEAALFRHEAA